MTARYPTAEICVEFRNFEAAKLIAAEDKRKQEEIAQEEANNPMAVLENRTKDSRREMEIMENLEELKERADSNAQTDLNDLIGDSLAKQQQLLAQILLKQEVLVNCLHLLITWTTKLLRRFLSISICLLARNRYFDRSGRKFSGLDISSIGNLKSEIL